IDTTALVSPQCTNTTPYQLGLDNGLYAVGNLRRMRSSGGRHVSYELYRDAARSQRWGDTPNSDTVSGTGSGSPQGVPIYARVAPQPPPPEGAYGDRPRDTLYYYPGVSSAATKPARARAPGFNGGGRRTPCSRRNAGNLATGSNPRSAHR